MKNQFSDIELIALMNRNKSNGSSSISEEDIEELRNRIEPLVVNATENAGNVTVVDFSGAVNRINAVLSEYPSKTISCSFVSSTFNNTTINTVQ